MFRFERLAQDTTSAARLGRFHTPHGPIDTPAFMPVGTQATVKGLYVEQLAAMGARCLLANTYHLMLRPGSELVRRMGGLHAWMRWDHALLTDSGGFQVFSLADISRIHDDGVTFKSHLDGSLIDLTPERSMRVQNELGADIIMAFDDCPPGDAPPPRVEQANERTLRWLDACVKAHARRDEQALFGIVQGGTDLAKRSWCATRVTQHDLPGYAIGGVAVGEAPEQVARVVTHTAALLPGDKPRYLMGVGYERDILHAVRAGVDLFDCVLPSRNGRNAYAFTPTGSLRLRNAKFARDPMPIDPACACPACARGYSRSYLRHLFMAGEMLGPMLVSLHNQHHFQRLLLDIRAAIRDNGWSGLVSSYPVLDAPAHPAITGDDS